MIFRTIYRQPLHVIIAVMIIALIVWTIVAVGFQNHKRLRRVVSGILTALSLAAILYSTIIHRTAETTQSIPFIRTIELIRQQPELIREMVMNAFLFFPFGLTLPYVLELLSKRNAEKHRKCVVLITIISALILSCTIELIQYFFDFGNCEFSDIVMNTLGAAIGCVSYIVSTWITSNIKVNCD